MFTDEEIQRYSRQILVPEVGAAGQAKIRKARVLCVGTGGLGSPAALYLAAAGVGTLGLVDNDLVEPSNLHRQILHFSTDVGRPKVVSARGKLDSLNPHVDVKVHRVCLEAGNALEILSGYDLALDGSDNFPTRYLLNDACFFRGIPLVSGAVLQLQGQVTTILPGEGPCYRCLFPEPPEPDAVQSCAEAGILGSVAGVVGSLQATEALKVILGLPGVLAGRLLTLNLASMSFREIPVPRRADCDLCGDRPTVTSLATYDRECGVTAVPK
jgi:molybdopterin/thiamine biosynthesis adenylyltransferase